MEAVVDLQSPVFDIRYFVLSVYFLQSRNKRATICRLYRPDFYGSLQYFASSCPMHVNRRA